MRKLMTGNEAAAWAVRLADVDYIPAFPITPQTEIIEKLSQWSAGGELRGRMVMLESEHSMVTAAGTAAATGVRAFTATSSQGLLYAMEMLYTTPGWRAPYVLVNVSRGLASPITLEPDHNDVLAARDSGCLQLHAATCQEVLDLVLLAFRTGEDPAVRLPVIVNLDGFYLSFTREPVLLPEEAAVRAFLPPYRAGVLAFRGGEPRAQGVAVLGGVPYSYFRYEAHLAAQAGLPAFERAARVFGRRFGRDYAPVERYRCEDAEYAFLMMGAYATKAKVAVDALRAEGMRIGLVRPVLLRPFPEEALVRALRPLKALAVVDQNLAPGRGGVLHAEVLAALQQAGLPGPRVAGYVGGLGGRDVTLSEFVEMARTLQQIAASGINPAPRLLFTAEELRQTETLQAVALGSD